MMIPGFYCLLSRPSFISPFTTCGSFLSVLSLPLTLTSCLRVYSWVKPIENMIKLNQEAWGSNLSSRKQAYIWKEISLNLNAAKYFPLKNVTNHILGPTGQELLFTYIFMAGLDLRCYGLSLVQAFSSCSARASHGSGFSCCGVWVLGAWASVVVALWLTCTMACGIFLDQGLNPCPLH